MTTVSTLARANAGHTLGSLAAVLCLLAVPCQAAATLPPDPGAAGRMTLAGVDANDNGIRDDLERHIAATFGRDERVLRTVSNAVIATQYGLLATSDRESRQAHAMLRRAGECMQAIAARLAPYGDALQQMETLILNTPRRRVAAAAHMARLDDPGESVDFLFSEEPRWSDACMRRVDEADGPEGPEGRLAGRE